MLICAEQRHLWCNLECLLLFKMLMHKFPHVALVDVSPK